MDENQEQKSVKPNSTAEARQSFFESEYRKATTKIMKLFEDNFQKNHQDLIAQHPGPVAFYLSLLHSLVLSPSAARDFSQHFTQVTYKTSLTFLEPSNTICERQQQRGMFARILPTWCRLAVTLTCIMKEKLPSRLYPTLSCWFVEFSDAIVDASSQLEDVEHVEEDAGVPKSLQRIMELWKIVSPNVPLPWMPTASLWLFLTALHAPPENVQRNKILQESLDSCLVFISTGFTHWKAISANEEKPKFAKLSAAILAQPSKIRACDITKLLCDAITSESPWQMSPESIFCQYLHERAALARKSKESSTRRRLQDQSKHYVK